MAPSGTDVTLEHPAIAMAGRVMLTLIFFLSGITHFTALDDYVALMPVTIVVHGVAVVADPDARMRVIQTSFFLKGVAMAGAALLVTQLGVAKRPS